MQRTCKLRLHYFFPHKNFHTDCASVPREMGTQLDSPDFL